EGDTQPTVAQGLTIADHGPPMQASGGAWMSDDSGIFVSHVSEDRAIALEIVVALERHGIKCWIAPRDVKPGRYDDDIVDAIDRCSTFLLVFSDKCNDSEYIGREVTVAGEAKKSILPVRIEDARPRRGILRMRLT